MNIDKYLMTEHIIYCRILYRSQRKYLIDLTT